MILPIVQAVGAGMSISDLYPVFPLRSHAACISWNMGEVLADFCAHVLVAPPVSVMLWETWSFCTLSRLLARCMSFKSLQPFVYTHPTHRKHFLC